MRNKLFIIVIAIILVIIPVGVFLREEKEISSAENRTLLKKEDIRISNLNEDLEKVLQDQFLYGESLKKIYNKFKNKITDISVGIIEKNNWMDLIPVGNDLFRLSNTDYIVYKPIKVDEKKENYLKMINNINEKNNDHPEIKFFVYNVVTDSILQNKNDYDKLIKDNLNKDIQYMSSTQINSYEDYKRCFYKTDHHWNKNGQYDGYLDIVRLLGIENPIQIKGVKEFEDIKFFGAKARILGNYNVYDEFIVNQYEYPQMNIKINYKNVEDYGKTKQFFNGDIPMGDIDENYYGDFYGWDDGIIEFSIPENKDKQNLLIFSNSYSNPLNKLIASSFKETYVIDLRRYELELGYKFIFEDFIKKHNIDKILVLGNFKYFTEEKSIIE